jgi:AAA+ superfamily predicted ATPase
MTEGPTIAGEWPPDLQFALRRLMLRALPLVEALPRPLGWAGSIDALVMMARDIPPAPVASRYSELVLRLQLSPVDEMVLIAAASADLDLRFASLWQIVGNRIDAMRPRIHGVLQLAEPDEQADVLAILDDRHSLRAFGLVTLAPGGDGALAQQIVATPALAGIVSGRDIDAMTLGVSHEPAVPARPTGTAITAALASKSPVAIVIDGPPGSGRGWLARELAAAAGRELATVTLDPERAGAQVAAMARTAVIDQLVPCVELPPGGHLPRAFAGAYHGPWIVIGDGRPALPPAYATIAVTTLRPDVAQRRELWTSAIGDDQVAGELARRFPLGVGAVFRAASDGAVRGGEPDMFAQAARDQLDARSDLAERVRTDRRLDDLVASPHTRALLEEIIAFARVRKRVFDDWGFSRRMRGGLKVLFSGPPGTGKTLSAEIIAAELDLDLFRIDLSMVVSKWVGETEKNLKQVFDQADAGGGILLFDEADALFGRRTSVNTANDRYANLEINYLLQRLEMHDGIVLLTTNLDGGIDEAFRRRLNFRVRFVAPDLEERVELWQLMIPRETPTSDRLDFSRAAEFDMPGGNIKNAALRAAILAADEGVALATRHLIAAAEREFTEIGRIAK